MEIKLSVLLFEFMSPGCYPSTRVKCGGLWVTQRFEAGVRGVPFLLFKTVWCSHVWVQPATYVHRAHVAVRDQLSGESFLFPPCFWGGFSSFCPAAYSSWSTFEFLHNSPVPAFCPTVGYRCKRLPQFLCVLLGANSSCWAFVVSRFISL